MLNDTPPHTVPNCLMCISYLSSKSISTETLKFSHGNYHSTKYIQHNRRLINSFYLEKTVAIQLLLEIKPNHYIYNKKNPRSTEHLSGFTKHTHTTGGK